VRLRWSNKCSIIWDAHDTGPHVNSSIAMSPLSSDETARVLDACEQLLHERAQIVELLSDLPASWSKVRTVLNELQSIVS
jgi:hypothetical protein